MEKNDDVTPATSPPWLNTSFVEKVLRSNGAKHRDGFVKTKDVSQSLDEDAGACVSSVHVTALSPGENFSSNLYRVRALSPDADANRDPRRSLIVKCIPAEETIALNVRAAGFFHNETYMYTKVAVQIQTVLDDVAPGRFPLLVPRCLHQGGFPDEFLVLEDLTAQGFQVADRRRGLGLRHSLLALRTLAHFHAASVAVLASDPSVSTTLVPALRTPQDDPFSRVIEGGFLSLAEACEDWPEVPKKYPSLLRRMSTRAYFHFGKMIQPDVGGFNTICHGDSWTNNMMFRSENGIPIEVRFVDFQLARVSSPASEVLYFLYTSLSDEVAENHMELLIREYHAALAEVLELLKLKGPSLVELKTDIEKHGFFALISLIVITPFIRSVKGKEPDMDKALQGNWKVNTHLYKTPHCRKWLSKWLIEFGKKGWLCENEFQ